MEFPSRLVCITTTILLSISLIQPLLAYSSSLHPSFYGIAVHRGRGIPLVVEVYVTEGDGSVEIEGVRVGTLARQSITEAVYAAVFTLGFSPFIFNYTVRINPMSPEVKMVEGPSLSLSVYIATLASLRNTELKRDIIATGTLNPDLTIGFVGFITEKARGTQEWNYSTLFYPELQDRKYIFVRKPIHIGPYAFTVEEIVTEPLNITNISIELTSVGWGLDAYNKSLLDSRYSLRLEPSSIGYLVDKAEDMVDIAYIQLDIFENHALRRIEEMINYISAKIIEDPTLPEFFAESINSTRELLVAHEILNRYKLDLAALYILAEAYQVASRAYFLLKLLEDPSSGLWEVDIELTRMETLALTVLNQALGNVNDTSRVFLLARSASLLVETNRSSRALRFTLNLAQLGIYNERIAFSISNRLSTILNYLQLSIIYSLIALLTEPTGQEVDIDKLLDYSIRYAKHLVGYAYSLSSYSNVYSKILEVANSNLWRAENLARSDNIVEKLAALDSALVSITYSSLYFALHPGYREVAPIRYFYVIDTANLLYNYVGAEPRTLMALELAYVQEKVETRILFLEEAITIAKLQIINMYNTLELEKKYYSSNETIQNTTQETTTEKRVLNTNREITARDLRNYISLYEPYIVILVMGVISSIIIHLLARKLRKV